MRKEAERMISCLAKPDKMSTDGIKAEDGKTGKTTKAQLP